MATQGQRRAQARAAVRQARTYYRRADTLGEKVERELDRLIKRKTLITPDQLRKLFELMNAYLQQIEIIQKAFTTLHYIIEQVGV